MNFVWSDVTIRSHFCGFLINPINLPLLESVGCRYEYNCIDQASGVEGD